jgi:hypothetical protein
MIRIYGNIFILPKKKGNYCSPSIVSDSIMKSSSSVGPLSVSEGEEQELPYCSHLHIVL